uniref:Uncharacterized protein n=1 Tax=Nelumbo nucifera TaxID=4432 RepID=A0A822ZBP6_NELNU|nr:TPA_asm: hypothetical protein HUJ06_015404 [Nelumbo nucifera]
MLQAQDDKYVVALYNGVLVLLRRQIISKKKKQIKTNESGLSSMLVIWPAGVGYKF